MTPTIPKHIIEEVKALLESGQPLPDEFKNILFDSKREHELIYAGKEREADVLASTMSVPLQPAKLFGEMTEGWRNMLIFGDNLQILKTLLDMKTRGDLVNGDGSQGVRMCYIDPPFATRREFRGTRGQTAYQDKVEGAEFIEFLRKRLIFIRDLLADDGTLYVHLDAKKGHYIKIILDELFGPERFRNEIVWWYYNKLQGNINRFPSNHECIYAYGKTPATRFKPLMEDREETSRLIKRVWDAKTGRLVNAKGPDGKVLYIEKDDRRVDDVWRISMLQPADRHERVDYPTQKPKALLSLMIAASTEPGDIVLDCFVGSGTTAVVAEELGRRWIAVDCGKLAIYFTQKRLLQLGGDKRSLLQIAPFTLYNAGLYDYDLLKDLVWDDFRAFALRLFQCRDDPHVVRRVPLDGYLGLDHVLVFNFTTHLDATLTEDFIDDLHEALGERLGRRFFIIAPAASVQFLEDYIERETKDHPVWNASDPLTGIGEEMSTLISDRRPFRRLPASVVRVQARGRAGVPR